MLVNKGEKVHVMTRRLFEGDLRRHFAGEVMEASESGVRLEGYVFVLDPTKNHFVRRVEKRVRIIGILDSGHIIKVIPPDVRLEDLKYLLSPDKRLVVTDGREFSLDVNEFGLGR